MTAEELAEVLKVVNANRPQVTQTLNFNAPVGQQIAHVDKIEAHFDKDMGMQIADIDVLSGEKGVCQKDVLRIVSFDAFITELSKSDRIKAKLHELAEHKEKPKERMKPFRAAMDAGVMTKPSWEAFKKEFGQDFISSKASFDDYLRKDKTPYEGGDYDKMIEDFKDI